MNQLDNRAASLSVDSLINYETVKVFLEVSNNSTFSTSTMKYTKERDMTVLCESIPNLLYSCKIACRF
jgi:ABC-type transport system involved in Fe-S cluster assembly fused permease/ATPase subunit